MPCDTQRSLTVYMFTIYAFSVFMQKNNGIYQLLLYNLSKHTVLTKCFKDGLRDKALCNTHSNTVSKITLFMDRDEE